MKPVTVTIEQLSPEGFAMEAAVEYSGVQRAWKLSKPWSDDEPLDLLSFGFIVERDGEYLFEAAVHDHGPGSTMCQSENLMFSWGAPWMNLDLVSAAKVLVEMAQIGEGLPVKQTVVIGGAVTDIAVVEIPFRVIFHADGFQAGIDDTSHADLACWSVWEGVTEPDMEATRYGWLLESDRYWFFNPDPDFFSEDFVQPAYFRAFAALVDKLNREKALPDDAVLFFRVPYDRASTDQGKEQDDAKSDPS